MKELNEKIHAFVDGELPAEERAEIIEQISADKSANAEYQWAQYLKSTLRSKCEPIKNDECWQRTKAQLDAIDRTKQVNGFVGRWGWAMCGIVAIFILGAILHNRIYGGQELSTSRMAGLYGSLVPLGTPSNQEAENVLKAAFGEAPMDLDSGRLNMVQMQRGQLEGRPAIEVVFQDQKGRFNLYIIQGIRAVTGSMADKGEPYSQVEINGFPALAWAEDGYGFVVSANRNVDEIRDLITVIRSQRP